MTLILTRSDVRQLLDYDSCIAAVEAAFHADSEGQTLPAAVLGSHVRGGGFHVKTAGLLVRRLYYAAKINANFPRNPSLHGLPTIQGVISLHDGADGKLLALMDSIEVTSIRTAAATAVAARYLARTDSHTVLIIGCGNQGRSQLRALSRVLAVDRVYAYDLDRVLADNYAREMSAELGISVSPVADYHDWSPASDVVVTCTPSHEPLLRKGDLAPGTFVAAVGADNELKHEIAPDLIASSTLVVDVLEQCAAIGDLHHALEAGVISKETVHAELAEVVSGTRRGRSASEEIIVFDSTGTALEDVAAASVVFERALAGGKGLEMNLGA